LYEEMERHTDMHTHTLHHHAGSTIRTLMLGLWMAIAMATSAHAAAGELEDKALLTREGAGLSRAEVVADLILWRRAGMDQFDGGPLYGFDSPERDQAMARYRAWRQGSAYAVELARLRGQASTDPMGH